MKKQSIMPSTFFTSLYIVSIGQKGCLSFLLSSTQTMLNPLNFSTIQLDKSLRTVSFFESCLIKYQTHPSIYRLSEIIHAYLTNNLQKSIDSQNFEYQDQALVFP